MEQSELFSYFYHLKQKIKSVDKYETKKLSINLIENIEVIIHPYFEISYDAKTDTYFFKGDETELCKEVFGKL